MWSQCSVLMFVLKRMRSSVFFCWWTSTCWRCKLAKGFPQCPLRGGARDSNLLSVLAVGSWGWCLQIKQFFTCSTARRARLWLPMAANLAGILSSVAISFSRGCGWKSRASLCIQHMLSHYKMNTDMHMLQLKNPKHRLHLKCSHTRLKFFMHNWTCPNYNNTNPHPQTTKLHKSEQILKIMQVNINALQYKITKSRHLASPQDERHNKHTGNQIASTP